MHTVNVRLLVILLVGLLVSAAGVFFLHAYQVGRSSQIFEDLAEDVLKRADEALAAGKTGEAEQLYDEAVKHLSNCVKLREDDIDLQERLGTLLADLAVRRQDNRIFGQALGYLEYVVRAEPGRSKARRRLVDLYMAAGRARDARFHLERYLLRDAPNDAELLVLLGQCQARLDEHLKAAETFQKAAEVAPDHLDAYTRLAAVLRNELDRPADGDQWIAKMLELNPQSARAHWLAAAYYRSAELYDLGLAEAQESLALEPDGREALLLASHCAVAQARQRLAQRQPDEARALFDQARQYTKRGTELDPTDVSMYLAQADVETISGNPEQAIELLQTSLEATGNHPILLWQLGSLLIDAGRLDEAQGVWEQLRDTGTAEIQAGFLGARLAYVRGNWRQAIQGFERIRSRLIRTPETAKQADLWMGRSYSELGNPDQAVLAYRRALDVDPTYVPAKAALIDTLVSMGRLDEALREYQQIAARVPAAGWLPVVRVMISRNRRQPPARQDWEQIERLLDQIAEALPDSPDVPLLQAEVLAAQGRAEEAESLLLKARDADPKQARLWAGLISLAQRQQDWERVEQLLAEAAQQSGDSLELRISKAFYLAQRYGSERAGQLAELAEVPDSYDEAARVQLWQTLLSLAQRLNERPLAARLARQIAQLQPNNVRARFTLLELALRDRDLEAVERVLQEIERIEGQGPLWHYGQAVRLSLLAGDKPDDPRLDEALGHLRQAGERRPSWSRVPLLKASIYHQQRKLNLALENYLQAIQMGDRNPEAVRRAAELLLREHRVDDALGLIALLDQQDGSRSGGLEEVELRARAMKGDLDRALELARKAAEGSDDYRDLLWLGQLLFGKAQQVQQSEDSSAGDLLLEEAGTAFRRATELGPTEPQSWISRVQFLMRTDKPQEAAEAVAAAQQALPPEHARLALPLCYALIGRLDLARQKYDQALAEAPADPQVVRAVVDFYIRTNNLAVADAQLEKFFDGTLKADPDDVSWARRARAGILMTHGRYPDLAKALSLVNENLRANPDQAIEDLRVKARILMAMPSRRQRTEAIEVLEELIERQVRPTAEDSFLLAQLYLREDAFTKFTAQMRALLTDYPDNPQFLATYVQALLQHNELAGAEIYLERLGQLAPKSFAYVQLSFERNFRRNQHRPEGELSELRDQLVIPLREFIDDPESVPRDRPSRLLRASSLLTSFSERLREDGKLLVANDLARQAELMLREYVDLRPEQRLALVPMLCSQGRLDDALDLLDRQWQSVEPNHVTSAVVAILRADGINRQQIERLEVIAERAARHFRRPQKLLVALAEIATKLEKYDQAEAHYREIIDSDSDSVVAMNNLAVILALRGTKLDEALRLVNRALALNGPNGAIIDSRATVYLAMGKPKEALADMEVAVADNPTPVRLFHQAQAFAAANRPTSAREAMRKAVKDGLKPEDLQPLELPAYERLSKLVQ